MWWPITDRPCGLVDHFLQFASGHCGNFTVKVSLWNGSGQRTSAISLCRHEWIIFQLKSSIDDFKWFPSTRFSEFQFQVHQVLLVCTFWSVSQVFSFLGFKMKTRVMWLETLVSISFLRSLQKFSPKSKLKGNAIWKLVYPSAWSSRHSPRHMLIELATFCKHVARFIVLFIALVISQQYIAIVRIRVSTW